MSLLVHVRVPDDGKPLASATGFDEDYIRARLSHIAQAADRAAQLNGGVLIW